jgi:hypothetical protein
MQLSYYTRVEKNIVPDIVVNIVDSFSHFKPLCSNPSVHKEIENGFIAEYNTCRVAFRMSSKLIIDIMVKTEKNSLLRFLKKINNMEFASREERIGQLLFELAIIPALFFEKDLFLVHSSSFVNKTNNAVLIGGTGGVGKTSLEIDLCMNKKLNFLNDDIAVISNDGLVYPHLSLPKIYAYNLKDNDELKRKIFKDKSFSDKLFWFLRKKFLGEDKVRRKIQPEKVYGGYSKKPAQLEKYYFLFRENVPGIKVKKISGEAAAENTVNIIKAEYYDFINHLYWHKYNCNISGKIPVFDIDEIIRRWGSGLKEVFSKVDNSVISIPFNINHRQMIGELSKILTND